MIVEVLTEEVKDKHGREPQKLIVSSFVFFHLGQQALPDPKGVLTVWNELKIYKSEDFADLQIEVIF